MKRHLFLRTLFALLAFAGIVWFCIPFHWNVSNVGNVTGIIICAAILAVALIYPAIQKLRRNSRTWRILFRAVFILFCAGVAWAAVLTGLMIFGINSAPPKQATVVVLGSKVNGHTPTADLMARINAAGKYLTENPQAKCIVSGGQGVGELETEAAAMKQYLVKQGIDASRIILEDKSTTTIENLSNSLAIIDQNGMSRDLAIVTDEYHQYRAGRIAKSIGAVPYSVCAATPWYIFSACYARELLALTKFLIIP